MRGVQETERGREDERSAVREAERMRGVQSQRQRG
jgi:hypothetical protein